MKKRKKSEDITMWVDGKKQLLPRQITFKIGRKILASFHINNFSVDLIKVKEESRLHLGEKRCGQ